MTDQPNHDDAANPVSVTAEKLPTTQQPPAANVVCDDTSMLWMHGLFFWMAVAVIGASFLMQSQGQETVFLPGAKTAMPELCASKRIFQVPCPGCGLTRSFISISHGQFARAWNFNPTSFLLYPFIFAQIPWQALQFGLIRKRGFGMSLPYVHYFPIAIAAFMLVRWLMLVPQIF